MWNHLDEDDDFPKNVMQKSRKFQRVHRLFRATE